MDSSSGDPIFLNTVLPGAASHSFGVAVAKLAGIPTPVIDQTLNMLADLESRTVNTEVIAQNQSSSQLIQPCWLLRNWISIN